MSVIYANNELYQLAPYDNEDELEESILKVRRELFGLNRIYLDVKKLIGKKGIQQNIPDGYLIDLSNSTPKLYMVENELRTHDIVKHIAVQLLQFSMAYESDPRIVRNILLKAIHERSDVQAHCEQYAIKNSFRNLDHLIDFLSLDGGFSVLVIIDKKPHKLDNFLITKFSFSVDVLELVRYKNIENNYFYFFEPFLQDVFTNAKGITTATNIDASKVDTVVVPARSEGFKEVYLGEKRWYEIRMENSMRQQIKNIAVYQVAPISAITHIAKVKSIEPWGEDGKWVLNFDGPAQEITPVVLKKEGRVKAPQSPRYTISSELLKANTLEDIW